MDRSKYQFEEINKTEAIQFKGLEENKYDVCEFFKDQGEFEIEFGRTRDELKIHRKGEFSRIVEPGDYVVLKNNKLEIYEKTYFESSFKKV